MNIGHNIYGSPVSQKDSYGTLTTIAYDALNRPVSCIMPNGGTRTAQYSTSQKNTVVTDEAGIVTKYEIDGFGRNAAKYREDGNGYNKLESYTYNECGHPASKTIYRTASEGVREEYGYDCFGRLTQKKVYELQSRLMYTENYTNVNDISSFTNRTITITYDPEKLELADGCTLTQEKDIYAGEIPGTKLTIISIGNGELVFKASYEIPSSQRMSGTINIVRFKSLTDGNKVLEYNINDLS